MEQKWKIRLSANEDVRDFVRTAEKCDFDIDIFHNRRIIDTKSILGVLSLDLTQVLTVRFYGKDTAFEDVLQRFCVA